MGDKGGAPQPPDFLGLAREQGLMGQQNVREATIANRPNISTPFGSQAWTQSPLGGGAGGKGGGPAGGNAPGGIGATAIGAQSPGGAAGMGAGKGGGGLNSPSQWTMNTGLSAPLGAANENIQNQIAAQSGTPLPSGEESRRAATEGVSALGRARLDPIWQQREAALNSNLTNQGLAPGSEISNVATRQFQQGRNDADLALEEMAQRTGREAQAQTFGQGVAARQLPFSQLGGLKGLMQAPGFNPAGTAAPADLTGAARDLFSGQMQGYGANQGKKGSSVGGLGQLGMGAGMLAMASDERVKENVERLPIEASPDEAPGVPVAIFEYVWAPGEKRIGVIAQDLEKVRPDLVIQLPGGMRMVNYVGLKGFLKAVAWRQ